MGRHWIHHQWNDIRLPPLPDTALPHLHDPFDPLFGLTLSPEDVEELDRRIADWRQPRRDNDPRNLAEVEALIERHLREWRRRPIVPLESFLVRPVSTNAQQSPPPLQAPHSLIPQPAPITGIVIEEPESEGDAESEGDNVSEDDK